MNTLYSTQGTDPKFLGIIVLAILLFAMTALAFRFINLYYGAKGELADTRAELDKAEQRIVNLQIQSGDMEIKADKYRKEAIRLENQKVLGLDTERVQNVLAHNRRWASVVDGS